MYPAFRKSQSVEMIPGIWYTDWFGVTESTRFSILANTKTEKLQHILFEMIVMMSTVAESYLYASKTNL